MQEGQDAFDIRAEIEDMLRVQDVGGFSVDLSVHTQDRGMYASRVSVKAICRFGTTRAHSIGYKSKLVSSQIPLVSFVYGWLLRRYA